MVVMLSKEQMRVLVFKRDKKYVGDLSDSVQKCLYENNTTNAALDVVEAEMFKEGLIK